MDNALRRADAIKTSGGVSEDAMKRLRATWNVIVKQASPTAYGLLRWMALIPSFVFLAAMVVLATEYRAVNIIFAVIAIAPLVVRWIERKVMEKRANRDDD